MDTKTKIFWWTMGILVAVSFGATFYRYMIKKDYVVQAQVDCDPYTETCFVWRCNPDSEEDGEKCTDDPEEDVWYYKIINKNVSRAQVCDASDETCEILSCVENEPDCEFVFCDESNKEDWDSSECTDPIKYAIENPLEEECKEGDEGCLEETNEEVEESVSEEQMIQTTEDMISAQENETKAENVEDAGVLPIERR